MSQRKSNGNKPGPQHLPVGLSQSVPRPQPEILYPPQDSARIIPHVDWSNLPASHELWQKSLPKHQPVQRDEDRKEPEVQAQVVHPQPAAPAQDMYQISKEDFKCIICLDIHEVLLADRGCGALLCEMCAARVRVCPNCRGPAQFERNAVLDRIMSNILIQCKCGESLAKRDIAAHKLNCRIERIVCPAETCRGLPAMERPDFVRHMKDIHMEQFMQAFARHFPNSFP